MIEGLEKVVQNILVYILIVSVLKGLIRNPKYGQYFQFFSGIILILLLFSPILTLFQAKDSWYDYLQRTILQQDSNQIKSELRIADSQWENVMTTEYREAVSQQILCIAKQEKKKLSDLQVTVKKTDEVWEIKKIEGKAENEKDAVQLQEKIAQYLMLRKEQVTIWT